MEATKAPILIAVYQNLNNNPRLDSLRMFEISRIATNNLKIIKVKNVGKCFQIPINKIIKGFDLIEKYK